MSMLNSMLGAVSASDFLPKIGTSTNNAIALWDGTDGSAVKNSSASIDNNNDLSGIRNAVFSGTLSASNLSGTNTGDQDLSGYVPYTGATSNLNLGVRSLTASNFSGSSSGTNTGDQTISLTGDVTGSGTGSFAATIAAGAVTYAKIQTASGASKILGSPSTGTSYQEISLGSGLSMSGGTLSATGTGGTVTSFSAGNLSPLFITSVSGATTTPALSFSLSNAAANTYLGNATSGSAAPSYTAAGALTKTDDTNVILTLGGNASTSLLRDASITVGWAGTLAAGRLNSNVVQSIVNDTNVTGTISAQNLTLGWGGVLSVGRGGTNASTAAMARVNLGLQIGVDVQAYSAELAAISSMSLLGLAARTAAGTWTARTMQAPAAGLTISNAGGVTGNPTFALADDLAALEALSGTGFATRTGTSTWAQRSFADVTNQTVWTYPDGISGNPYVSLSSTLALPGTLKLGGVVDGQLNNLNNLGNVNSVTTSGAATGITDYSTVSSIGGLGTDILTGWRFTPTGDIIVTKLQVLDAMFTSGSRDVGLYASGGALLASASVAKTDTLNGKFREKSITSLILTSGTSYFIGVIAKASDAWVVGVSGQTYSNVTFSSSRYTSFTQSTLPSTDSTDTTGVGVTIPCASILAQPATVTFSVTASTGNTYTTGKMGIGTNSIPSTTARLQVEGSASQSTTYNGAVFSPTLTQTGNGQSTHTLQVFGTHIVNGSGVNSAETLRLGGSFTATTTINNAFGLHILASLGSGTINNAYGIFSEKPGVGTNRTAAWLEDFCVGAAFTATTPPANGCRIAGSAVIGNGANSTSATGPFLYFTTSAGAPTGVPTSYTGLVPIHYDTTNNKLYVYNGAWKSVTLT